MKVRSRLQCPGWAVVPRAIVARSWRSSRVTVPGSLLPSSSISSVDVQLGGVEHQLSHWFVDDDPDPCLTGERAGGQIGREGQLVALGLDRAGEPVGVGHGPYGIGP